MNPIEDLFLRLLKGIRLLLFFCLVSTLFLPGVSAQSSISGNVLSAEDNQPIFGSTIVVAGTTTGTTSREDGYFTIQIPSESAILIVSHVGFLSQRMPVNQRSTINVTLKTIPELLTEVVVTGYSTQARDEITGAVSIPSVERINRYKAPSVFQKLKGQIPGVQVFTNGSAPNSPANIRIRGFGSFTNNDPLIIIDGVPVFDPSLNWLNPSDISSIQVLKDASAASIYGARANNGVIIIETKRGKAGKTEVNYRTFSGFQSPSGMPHDYLIRDPLEYGQYLWQLYQNAGLTPPSAIYGDGAEPVLPDYIWPENQVPVDEASYSYPSNPVTRANKAGTNWSKEVLEAGFTTDHHLQLSGGSDKSKFAFSAGYLKQNGAFKYNYLERFSFRINSSFQAGQFTFGETVTLARRKNNYTSINLLRHSIVPIYDIRGNFTGNNPVAHLERNKDDQAVSFDGMGSLFGEWKITPWLKAKTNLGFTFSQQTQLDFSFPDLVERTSHIPIILLTAKADIESRLEGLERGADAYLAKPFNKEELIVRLRKLVELRQQLQARYNSLAPATPSEDKATQQEDAFLQKLRTIIEAHLEEDGFGIPQLCREMGISRTQLHRKLKALTNKSTSQVIRTIRMQKAKYLLEHSALNISEIGYEVGYANPSYFTQEFIKEFGLAPSQFRMEQ